MKSKILNLLLILSSLIGYLEWGKNNSTFLLQGEIEVISRLLKNPGTAIHPFTVLPLFGQVLLLYTLFQKKPNKILTLIGLTCLSLLLVLMFVIGIMSANLKILFSTLPFLITAVFVILEMRKKNENTQSTTTLS